MVDCMTKDAWSAELEPVEDGHLGVLDKRHRFSPRVPEDEKRMPDDKPDFCQQVELTHLFIFAVNNHSRSLFLSLYFYFPLSPNFTPPIHRLFLHSRLHFQTPPHTKHSASSKMRVARSTNLLPVTTFLISSVFLSIVLPTRTAASPSPAVDKRLEFLLARHDGEDDSMDMDVDEVNASTEDTPAVDDAMASASISSAITSSSEASTPNSSAPSHEHSHESHGAEKAPDPHSHSHSAALEILNDTDIHRWHQFPPTYLDADFRLDADSAIFGEEFDDSWNLEEVESHKGLALVHAFLMGLAYFGVLPVGE